MNCSICGKITGTGIDHIDCVEKKKIEMRDENFKLEIPEKLNLAKNSDDMAIEIKAILDHMKREKSLS
ncbi:MAG: hypothetical protein K8823_119 [Cenarchaeum symbiont of Oopsacas minuta]|nr:hypothetical protein [Cenarchaeum symbiont of Oopsacas minuta]